MASLTKPILELLNGEDLEKILEIQAEIKEQLKKQTSENDDFNEYVAAKLGIYSQVFQKYTVLLNEVRGDMDYIYGRLRKIKTHLAQTRPSQFAAAIEKHKVEESE